MTRGKIPSSIRKYEMRARSSKSPEKSTEERRLTLKEMVNGANTTPRAVRFYEAEKLIQAIARSPGGHRLFEESELGKLRLIIDLRTCGFSIDEIREILEAKTQDTSVRTAAQRVQGLLSRHLQELQRRIGIIERIGREFGASIQVLERCARCTDPRGLEACSTCEVPRQPLVPPSFHHIWAGAEREELPSFADRRDSHRETNQIKNRTVG